MRFKKTSLATVVALAACLSWLPAAPAQAATFDVVSSLHSVPAELQEAYDTALNLAYAEPDAVSLPVVEEGRVVVMMRDVRGLKRAANKTADPALRKHVQDDHQRGRSTVVDHGRRTRDESYADRADAVRYANEQARNEKNLVAAETNPLNGKIHLLVKKWTPALSADLAKRFTGAQIEVEVYPGLEPMQPQDRGNDYSPYYSGARDAQGCTMGFAYGEGAYYVTAGHCGGVGSYVPLPNGGSAEYQQRPGVGDAMLAHMTNGSTSANMWRGPASGAWGQHVSGMSPNPVRAGEPFSVSAGYSGEQGTYYVQMTDVDWPDLNGTMTYHVTVSYGNGSLHTQAGDSGSPVFQDQGDTLLARGIFDGANQAGQVFFTDIKLVDPYFAPSIYV